LLVAIEDRLRPNNREISEHGGRKAITGIVIGMYRTSCLICATERNWGIAISSSTATLPGNYFSPAALLVCRSFWEAPGLHRYNLMVEPSGPVAKALLTPLGRAFACHKVPRNRMPARAILVAFVFAASRLALADCREPETGTKNIPVFSPPLGEIVVGAGRLQFYSAPNANCAMAGVFVIPKDELIAYARSNDGWSSVMYSDPKTGDNVSGWARSSRLKETGTVGH
jgi:hypothetical protein